MGDDELRRAQREPAGILRWSARLAYQQGVCNHFSVLAPAIARGLADQAPMFDAHAQKHLAAIMRVLDREEPGYAS